MPGVSAASFVIAVLIVSGPAAPSPLRPQSPRIQHAVQAALRDSATFRLVVDALAGRDVIVLIVARPCDFGRREACFVHDVVTSGRYRFLRVQVRDDIPYPRLAGLIAHELWHAVEAIDTDRTSTDSSAPLGAPGRACDQQYLQTCYETDEAIAVQARVVDELRGARLDAVREIAPVGSR